MTANDRSATLDPEPRPPRRSYDTPVLTVHGTVAQLTRATGPFAPDGIIGFSIISDRAAKRDFAPVDTQAVLARLLTVPVESWSYSAEAPTVRHIGPMAQDFAAAFGVGGDDRRIAMVDAHGVAFAAIQALHSRLEERDRRVDALQREVEELRRALVS